MPIPKGPVIPAWPGPDPAIYLGCGGVGGPGSIVQLDFRGKVLGKIELAETPYGLAADRAGLVAALPGANIGRVVRIDRTGKVETLLKDPSGLPAPIAVAADPRSGDLLVADNVADVILLLPAGKASEARQLVAIKGHEGHCQDMSVSFAADGHLLFGGTGPVGVYRFKGSATVDLGHPIVAEPGAVAAEVGSDRWASALESELRMFEGSREVAAIPYPSGRRRWHGALSYGPGGSPVVALHLGGNQYEVVQVDLEKKGFRTLFTWDSDRLVCLTIGPKLPWKD
jgi:hypothetical protein